MCIFVTELPKYSDCRTMLWLLCRSLTSLTGSEEEAKNELISCSTEHCASLQAAAGDLLQTVDVTGNAVNALGMHVTDFCDKMQEVRSA